MQLFRKKFKPYFFVIIFLLLCVFYFLNSILLCPIGASLICTVTSFVLVFGFILNKDNITQLIKERDKGELKYIFLCGLFIIFILFTLFVIFALRFPFYSDDDWSLFNDFLFSEDLLSSILSRHNQHPCFLINGILATNLLYFGGHTIGPTFLNAFSLFTVSFLFFKTLYYQLRRTISTIRALTLSLCLMSFTYWMSNSVSMFWSIGYIPVLGAVLAIYGLSKQSKWGFEKGLIVFLLGSLLISLSHGTGAIVWWLGFFCSIFQQQSKKRIVFYFLIGLIGSLLTIGYGAHTEHSILVSNFPTLLASIPGFIGAPVSIILLLFISEENLVYVSIIIGSLGIAAYCYFLYNSVIRKLKGDFSEAQLFFHLLVFFSFGCCFLITLGRVQNDLSIIIKGQYFIWTSIFWFSLVGLLLLQLIENKKLKIYINLPYYFSLALFIVLFLYNIARIDLRLMYYNHQTMALLDVVINPDISGNEKFLIHPNEEIPDLRKTVLNVVNELKRKKINVFSHDWSLIINKSFTKNYIAKNSSLVGDFEKLSLDNDVLLKGYLSSSSFDVLPEVIIVVDRDTIIGLGLPLSNRDNRKPKKAALYNFFNLLPRPISQFPGISNYYFCQLRPSSTPYDLTNLKLFGLDGKKARAISTSY